MREPRSVTEEDRRLFLQLTRELLSVRPLEPRAGLGEGSSDDTPDPRHGIEPDDISGYGADPPWV